MSQTTNTPNTVGEYFRQLQILFFAMLVGQILFALISYFVLKPELTADQDMANLMLYLVPAMAIGAIIGSRLLFNQQIAAISSSTSLGEKLSQYRAASILRYALLEGAGLFALVSYLITGNIIFIGIALGVILFFLQFTPSINRVINELSLAGADQSAIQNSDTSLI